MVRIDLQDLGQELVAPSDGFGLEVVAQGPVAEHLEEGEVAGIPDLVDVAGPDALLEVGEPSASGVLLSEEIRYQGVHPCGCEKDSRIVLRHEGCGTDLRVAALFKEIDVGFSHFLSVHVNTPILWRPLWTFNKKSVGSWMGRFTATGGRGPLRGLPCPVRWIHRIRTACARASPRSPG